MGNFLESVLPVLIAAVFVVARIVFVLRRRRLNRQRDENALVRTATQRPARGFVSWENEFRDGAAAENAGDGGPAPAAPAGGDEAFSAWNLSVDDDPPAAAIPSRLLETPRPLAAALTGLPELPPPARFVPERAAQHRRPSVPASPDRRFRGLSSVQKGVIWAEILGAPKGLQD